MMANRFVVRAKLARFATGCRCTSELKVSYQAQMAVPVGSSAHLVMCCLTNIHIVATIINRFFKVLPISTAIQKCCLAACVIIMIDWLCNVYTCTSHFYTHLLPVLLLIMLIILSYWSD